MEAVRQIVKIPKDHEIKIKVPKYVPENEMIEVILIYKQKQDTFKQKIQEMKKAAKDSLFLADMKEISEDFRTVDLEELREDEI